MSKNESIERMAGEILEQQLVEILEQYHYFRSWKEVGLEELINNAQSEKTLWKDSYSSYARRLKNNMARIIEIAETLTKTKRSN